MSALCEEFYADEDDLAVLLSEFTKLGDFKYIEMYSQLNEENKCYKDAIHILEQDKWMTKSRRCNFLVVDSSASLMSDILDKSDGSGRIISIHQGFNLDSIVLKLGGTKENNTLIASVVDTIGDTTRAKEIQKMFRKVVMKQSKKISDTRVMPNAMEKLKAGWRLTAGLGYPDIRDVKLPEL